MNTIDTEQRFIDLKEIFSEVEYFLEFNRKALIDLLVWKIDLWEFWEIWDAKYAKALKRSESLDTLYSNGGMWRLAISEWWPNEIQYYVSEQKKCIEILTDLWVQ